MVSRSGGARLGLWLGVALLVIVLDQLTKALVVEQFMLHETRPVTSFFNLVRAHNSGAAFSFLASAAGWQRWFFIVLGIAASVFIVWMLRRHPEQTLFCLAISLILGGALGNVIDRLRLGHVVDFVLWYWKDWHWPAFNVADSAITAGAVLLVVSGLFAGKPAPAGGARR